MKTKIAIVLITLLLIAAAFGYYKFNQKVAGLENETPDYTISANDLFNEFETDEVSALEKYENKILLVTGIVEDIKETDSLTNIILSADNAMVGGVNCAFPKHFNLPNKGDEVSIKGRCLGYLMTVILNNCTMEQCGEK